MSDNNTKPVTLTPTASQMFLRLETEKHQIVLQQNALVAGAGLSIEGRYQWTQENGIVTLRQRQDRLNESQETRERMVI